MNQEILYRLALTLVPNIGDVQARLLVQEFGDAGSIFRAKLSQLEKIEGIGTVRAMSIKKFDEFYLAEKELAFMESQHIQSLFLTDSQYPQRLLNCYDPPTLLFYKGQVNFNASKVIAIVGTRNHSEYGKQFTEKLIREIADQNILIVSGLAFGIDGLAHKSALKNKLPTIGVVGHGLDKIYPYEHASLAKEMIRQQGGILSEFFSGTKPDKHNFPLRNRIVAGMSDATVVIETRIKGGSMITANLANAYNRDVFALPGRVNDSLSSGCNHLIKYNKAILLTDADEMLEILGWKERKKQSAHKQKELFVELSETEKMVVDLLSEKSSVHIDELNAVLNLTSSAIASALLNLELQNMITSLPGKMYKLT